MRSFIIVFIPERYLEDEVKDNEVGRTCGTHGRGDKCTGLLCERPKERDYPKDRGVDGWMGSK
jgi:hypothetical protein